MEEETEALEEDAGGRWSDVHTTNHGDHFYMPTESDPRSNMLSVVCRDCWNGASYDPTVMQLKNGQIISKE